MKNNERIFIENNIIKYYTTDLENIYVTSDDGITTIIENDKYNLRVVKEKLYMQYKENDKKVKRNAFLVKVDTVTIGMNLTNLVINNANLSLVETLFCSGFVLSGTLVGTARFINNKQNKVISYLVENEETVMSVLKNSGDDRILKIFNMYESLNIDEDYMFNFLNQLELEDLIKLKDKVMSVNFFQNCSKVKKMMNGGVNKF